MDTKAALGRDGDTIAHRMSEIGCCEGLAFDARCKQRQTKKVRISFPLVRNTDR